MKTPGCLMAELKQAPRDGPDGRLVYVKSGAPKR
jgi:hypothetical protein